MSWLVVVLAGWIVTALAVALVVGRGIRMARGAECSPSAETAAPPRAVLPTRRDTVEPAAANCPVIATADVGHPTEDGLADHGSAHEPSLTAAR